MPDRIRSCDNLSAFKASLKTYLSKETYYSSRFYRFYVLLIEFIEGFKENDSKVRPHPSCGGRILQRSLIFIFTVWPTVHTNINPSHGAFRKRCSNRANFKTPALCYRVDENGAFH